MKSIDPWVLFIRLLWFTMLVVVLVSILQVRRDVRELRRRAPIKVTVTHQRVYAGLPPVAGLERPRR